MPTNSAVEGESCNDEDDSGGAVSVVVVVVWLLLMMTLYMLMAGAKTMRQKKWKMVRGSTVRHSNSLVVERFVHAIVHSTPVFELVSVAIGQFVDLLDRARCFVLRVDDASLATDRSLAV